MKKHLNIYHILLTVSLCCWLGQSIRLSAQSTTIQKRVYLPKSNNAYSRDIVETTPGNFVLIGQSIDSVGNQLENHLTLAGVDNNGNLQWHKNYGSNKFRYMHIGGTSRNILKYKGFLYSALSVIDSNFKEPGTLTKFNFNGDTIWQKKYYEANPTTQSFFNSVCPSVDNGFLITGAIQTNTPSYNGHPTVGLYLLKTDANGNKLWDKTLYKSNLDLTQTGVDVVQDSASKKIIIVGSQDKNVTSTANLLVLDSVGNLLVQKGLNASSLGDGLMNVIKTKDGNFIASGLIAYPIVNLDQTSRSFLVKFDTNANTIFTKEYDTVSYDNLITRLSELPNGEIVTGGILEVTHKYTNGLKYLTRIMKVDQNGNFLWKKYFDNFKDAHNTETLLGLSVTNNKEISFTSFCECAEPSPITFMFYRTDTNYCDVNAVACYSETMVGIKELNVFQNKLRVYPNPVKDFCTIDLEQENFKSIGLKNVMSETVFEIKKVSGKTLTIDLSDLQCGVYTLVAISKSDQLFTKKLIVNK